jgi:hypothetical protein
MVLFSLSAFFLARANAAPATFRSMASSSRSEARSEGFWRVQPIWSRIWPTRPLLALFYYFANREEIDASIEAGETFAEKLRQETPSLLQQKLEGKA